MAAVVKTAPGAGNVTVMRVPEPQCGPGQVKIEVAFSGICGTDLHVYHDRFRNYPPVILGHEFSGVVTEVGAGVHSLRPGDRVTVLPASAVICGSCEYCRQGYYMFCPVRRGMGHGVNGSFTRFAVVREDQVYRLPPGLSLEEGALAEPFASAVQAVEEPGEFRFGDTVLISGPGAIGLLCLLLLGHRTRTIVAGTASDQLRLELAGKLGRYVQLGIVGAEITVPFDLLLYKQIRLWGSVGYSARTWVRVMQILGQNRLDLSRLVTHKLPLSRWREGFDLCESKQAVKVLLYYDET